MIFLILIVFFTNLFSMDRDFSAIWLKPVAKELRDKHSYLSENQIVQTLALLKEANSNHIGKWIINKIECIEQKAPYDTLILPNFNKNLDETSLYLIGDSVQKFSIASLIQNPHNAPLTVLQTVWKTPTEGYFLMHYKFALWNNIKRDYVTHVTKFLCKAKIFPNQKLVHFEQISNDVDKITLIKLDDTRTHMIISDANNIETQIKL